MTTTTSPPTVNEWLAAMVDARADERETSNRTIERRLAEQEFTELPVLSIRSRVHERDAAGFIAQALGDIRAYMQEHHAFPAGPPITISRTCNAEGIDVEAGWPVIEPISGTNRIHSGALPSALVRTVNGHIRAVRG